VSARLPHSGGIAIKTRLAATITVTLAMVLTTTAGAIAQVDDAPAYFTASVGEPREFLPADMGAPDDDGVIRGRGTLLIEQPIRASDPRVSGLLSISNNVDIHEYGGGVVGVNVNSLRIANSEGAWTGPGTGFFSSGASGDLSVAVAVLRGEGAFEGMSVILNHGTAEDDRGPYEFFQGIIVDGDIAPPPAPPPAE